MSSYIHPVLPADVPFDERAVDFFSAFYKISDTPTAHEAYAGFFAPDATFVLASKTVVGYDEILAARQGMWAGVESRRHLVSKIFPFGAESDEYMLYGIVQHTSKTGQTSEKEWAARAELAEDADGQLMFTLYQVYLDTAAPAS